MLNASLEEVAGLLAQQKLSSVELTEECLRRARDSQVNAFITLNQEASLAQARAADELRHQGRATPLTGVPIAHKDIFCAKNWLT
ncbi:MAG TPA: amidase family protein, partial [Burkholderiales bacterium]|nr:amidase family protein [Burkholderiales bacterium]